LAWTSASVVLARWNMALNLIENDIRGLAIDVDSAFASVAGLPAGDGLAHLLSRMVPGADTGAHVPVLLAHLGIPANAALPTDKAARREVLGLCIAIPEIQIR
jgi:hypothetical protein